MLDLHIYSNHKSLNPALCCHNLSSCLPFPHKKQVPVPSKKIRTRPAGPTGPGPSDKAAQGQARRKKKKKRHSFLSVFLSLIFLLRPVFSVGGFCSPASSPLPSTKALAPWTVLWCPPTVQLSLGYNLAHTAQHKHAADLHLQPSKAQGPLHCIVLQHFSASLRLLQESLS